MRWMKDNSRPYRETCSVRHGGRVSLIQLNCHDSVSALQRYSTRVVISIWAAACHAELASVHLNTTIRAVGTHLLLPSSEQLVNGSMAACVTAYRQSSNLHSVPSFSSI